MARRAATPPPPQSAQLTPAAMQVGIDRLRKRIAEVEQFDPCTVTDQFDIPTRDILNASIDDSLVRTFGHGTVEYNRYIDAANLDNGPYNYAYEVPIQLVQQSLAISKARSIALLGQAVQSLEEQLAEETVRPAASSAAHQRDLSKVFIVHGHDEGPREAVRSFLLRLGFEPIVLHDQPNKGRTIITKFREEAGDAGFAVVLMTADDEGRARSATDLKPRARQNVVFELGFFIGELGPERVAALVKGGVERPSDFDGVVYIDLDDGGAWKMMLARELRAAGLDFDANKVFG